MGVDHTVPMARVPYPDPATLDPNTKAFLDRLPPLNVFRMLAGGEGLLAAFARFGNHLLYKSALDPVLREIAIIRVGVLSGAGYEVFQHERIAREIGMSDELIAGIHAGPDDPAFDELQRLVMRFTDDVVANVRAGDETFAPLLARLSVREVQELVMTIGFYMAVSRFLETFDVEVEVEATSMAEGGRPAAARPACARRRRRPGRSRPRGRRGSADRQRSGDRPAVRPRGGRGRRRRSGSGERGRDGPSRRGRGWHRGGGRRRRVAAGGDRPHDGGHGRELGGLDGVVYNVGIGGRMGLDGIEPDDWDRVMAVNLRGAALVAKAALGSLADGGFVVFISSVPA